MGSRRGGLSHQGRYSRIMNILGNIDLCINSHFLHGKLLSMLLQLSGRLMSTADPLLKDFAHGPRSA